MFSCFLKNLSYKDVAFRFLFFLFEICIAYPPILGMGHTSILPTSSSRVSSFLDFFLEVMLVCACPLFDFHFLCVLEKGFAYLLGT